MPVQNYLSGDTAVKISRGVEEALADGRAAAGDPLPPVRALATRLGVSPATAAAAYRRCASAASPSPTAPAARASAPPPPSPPPPPPPCPPAGPLPPRGIPVRVCLP